MTEKLSSLQKRLNKPIIDRVLRQFGDFPINVEITSEMSNRQIFGLLVDSRSKDNKDRPLGGYKNKYGEPKHS